ncbi:MAG: hypothetical protein R2795_06050 [Saprospiraceae bacterium]
MSTETNDLIQTLMKRAKAHSWKNVCRGLAVIALLLATAYSISAQGWEVSFGGNNEDFGFAVAQTIDEGYLVAGYSESFGSDNDFDIYLVRTDVDGTLLWERTFDEGYIEQANDILPLEDGSFLILGNANDPTGTPQGTPSQIYLIKVSQRGTLLWSKRFENNGFAQSGKQIIPVAGGGYAIIGSTAPASGNSDDILLMRLDAEANELWREVYGTPYTDAGKGLAEVPGGFVFAANVKGDQSPDNDIAIYRVNESGGLVSLKVYGDTSDNEDVNDLVKTQDGNLVLAGSANNFNYGYIIKSDFNGDTLWTRTISAGPFDNELRAVTELPDGSIVATGLSSLTESTPGILVVKLSADGDLIWVRGLGEEFADLRYGEDIIHTIDGGLVVAGYSSQAGQVFINDLTLVRVDGEGNYFTNMIRGKVFWSLDGCNPYETGDIPLSNWVVEVAGEDQRFLGTTDADGNYSIPVDIGSYTVRILPRNDAWDVCSPVSFPVDFTADYDTLVYNFPVRSMGDGCPLLSVDMTAEPLTVCEQAQYTIYYANEGSALAEDAYVEIVLDDELTFLNASVDTSLETTHSIIIRLGDLAPLANGSFTLTVMVGCEGIQDLQAATVSANIYPAVFCAEPDPDWNMSGISISGRCENEQIIFTARNTGSAPTDGTQGFVIVEDVILFLEGEDNTIPTLNPGESVDIPTSGGIQPNEMGATYRMIAEQVQGHPGNSYLTVAVEGCTTGGAETYTTGVVAQFPENDQDPYVDIDVQEIFSTTGLANIMIGHPRGYLDSIITTNTDLEYTVLFANTGSDTLNRLVIRDTLPAELDLSTLVVGAASHPYDYEIYNGGILKITFNDLSLVPTNGGTEEGENRGFVKYTLSQKHNLALGTVISNRAAVYFDYLAPQVTNEVRHVLACDNFLTEGCLTVDVDEPIAGTELKIKVLPNPFGTAAVFDIQGCACEKVEMIVRDMLGREVRRETFHGTPFTFYRQNLSSALYFFELRYNQQVIQTGKIIAQ